MKYYSAIKELLKRCNDMDECHLHCVKGKKPDTKGDILCDFVYETLWKRQVYRDRKQVIGYWERQVEEGVECKRAQRKFWAC